MDIQFSFSWRLLRLIVAVMTMLLSFCHDLLIGACKTNSNKVRIVSETKDLISGTKRIGRIRYHYFDEECADDTRDSLANTKPEACSDILLMGVGAAMSVDNYDNVAKHIVIKSGSSSLVLVISDSNPGNIVKLSSTKFADLSNYIHLNQDLIPICNKTKDKEEKNKPNFLIGGHSASGQAALESAQQNLLNFAPAGFVGLDPYDTSTIHSILDFPTLNWGFSHTTCLVQVEKAAKGAYKISSPDIGRVLYSIDNHKNGMAHCVFTDHGCKVAGFDVCPTDGNHEWVYEGVAESINLFVNATKESHFSKETFQLPSTRSGQVSLYTNDDEVDGNWNRKADINYGYNESKNLRESTHARLVLAWMILVIMALVRFLRRPWLQ